ncbi:uncharacterized protein [Neodiprion pinetum]|uniref:uncharacterized protein isoform X2 n=1 Tax=Neodiprion pinetum TaxID=441929 RepID=UPI001EDE33F8|nr:uncharacterized protein LOC124213547 isoform X3 [Neodiprion pinetum]
MLFEHLGRPIKFHLVNVSDKEKLELSRLITANGGVVSENSLIKFTIRNPHVGNEEVYHVNFIHNCVKQNKILDITKYRHGAMGIGCPMSQFLRGSTSCMVDSDASEARPDLLLRSKNNFRTWEKQKMVNYLIENNLISQARGNRVWKRMIDKGLLKHRTFHSLNNHFRKYMLPNIHLYKMDSKSLAKFLRLKM